MYYPSMVEFLFIISVNCVLLHKVYTSVQISCYHCHGSKAIEFIFVVVHFLIPFIIVGVLYTGDCGGSKVLAAHQCMSL